VTAVVGYVVDNTLSSAVISMSPFLFHRNFLHYLYNKHTPSTLAAYIQLAYFVS